MPSQHASPTLPRDPAVRAPSSASRRPARRAPRAAAVADAPAAAPSSPPAGPPSRWSHPDDAGLVARVLAGEDAPFAVLVERYQGGLFRFAAGMVGDGDLAADLVQDAFVKAYAALGRCRSPERFGAWVFRILANRCKDHLKRRRVRAVPLDAAVVAAPGSDSPAAELGRAGLREAVERALAALPESQREAFLLKHLEGRPYEEIAATLGVSVGALKMRVMRAREALQARLAAWR